MRIQSIKCPQCGSTHNIQLEENLYSCENCHTHFKYSSFDQKILHQHVYQENRFSFADHKFISVVIVATFITVMAILFLLFNDKSDSEVASFPVQDNHEVKQKPQPVLTANNHEVSNTVFSEAPPVMDTCQLPQPLSSEDFFVYAGGAYSGKKVDIIIDDSGHQATQMDVLVNETRKPVALILSAYEPTIWQI